MTSPIAGRNSIRSWIAWWMALRATARSENSTGSFWVTPRLAAPFARSRGVRGRLGCRSARHARPQSCELMSRTRGSRNNLLGVRLCRYQDVIAIDLGAIGGPDLGREVGQATPLNCRPSEIISRPRSRITCRSWEVACRKLLIARTWGTRCSPC